jgi:Type I restriction enzyme R protein N terminus (HSDR_N)
MDGIGYQMSNEAELRAWVIDQWLRDHGFENHQIRLESSFVISLGRGSFTVGNNGKDRSNLARGRADYLVRTSDGQNLLVIEAKAPGSSLDEESRIQAISYARLLKEGGIAPFAIVTNGQNSQIFDSITGQPIEGNTIQTAHPYAVAGFRVSGDDFACRTEALEHLISLSGDNLITFCRAQVNSRMALLRSDEIHSGLKYIPSLYVPRASLEVSLDKLIGASRQTILVIGPPQVGKTNFVCNYVGRQLERGHPACSIRPLPKPLDCSRRFALISNGR